MRSRCFAIVMLAGAMVAHADDHPSDYGPPPPLPIASPITDHFALRGDYWWGRVNTTARIDSGSGTNVAPGTTLSAEQDLGLTDKAYMLRMEIIFRLEERSRLRVNFLDLRRSGDSTIDQTVVFGNQTFAANAPLQSEIDWRQMDITYTYSFLRGETYELGAGVGVHLIEAEATTQVPDTPQREDYSGADPFATAALDGTWRFARHWSLNARGQYLHVTISGTSGTLGIYHADLQYRWRRNLAFGVGYEREQVQLDLEHSNPSGLIEMNISGPEAFFRVSF